MPPAGETTPWRAMPAPMMKSRYSSGKMTRRREGRAGSESRRGGDARRGHGDRARQRHAKRECEALVSRFYEGIAAAGRDRATNTERAFGVLRARIFPESSR